MTNDEEAPVDTKTKISIHVNQHQHGLESGQVTGAQIKALAAIPEANLLFREVQGPGDDEQIHNETVVHIRHGDQFYDMPPGNFGH
jgi:Multiubiquitin